jgi:hypothetical protein
MAAAFAGYLAGDKAALTKALQAHRDAADATTRRIAATKAAEIINRAPLKGFTQEQVVGGRTLPPEVIPLIHRSGPELGRTLRKAIVITHNLVTRYLLSQHRLWPRSSRS